MRAPILNPPERRGLYLSVPLFAAVFLTAPAVADVLFDTGAGADRSEGIPLHDNLLSDDSPQKLAVRFAAEDEARIAAVDLWLRISRAGEIALKLYTDSGGLPGDELYSEIFRHTEPSPAPQWLVFGGLDWSLPAGVYWLALEPVRGSGFSAAAVSGAPEPQELHAYFDADINAWVAYQDSLGVRVNGSIGGVNISASGSAAAAMASSGRSGDVLDIFNATINEAARPQAFSFAGDSRLGSAAARGKTLYGSKQANGATAVAGLEVGAWATAAGDEGAVSAHGIAFRTYRYAGGTPATVVLNARLEGKFEQFSTERPDGVVEILTEISVIDNAAFEARLPDDPELFETFFFGFPDQQTPDADPFHLYLSRPATRFASGEIAGTVDAFDFSPATTLSQVYQLTFKLVPDQRFTVFFDIAAYSASSCVADSCGAGSAQFFNSLSSAPVFFTDAKGRAVETIEAVDQANAVPGVAGFANQLKALYRFVADIPAAALSAGDPRTAEFRRHGLLNQLNAIDSLLDEEDFQRAAERLRAMLDRFEREPETRDWSRHPEEKLAYQLLRGLLADIVAVCPECGR